MIFEPLDFIEKPLHMKYCIYNNSYMFTVVGIPAMKKFTKLKVLFICTGNSARSLMAEALLRSKADKQFEVSSAGTHPEQVDDRALAALTSFGLPKKSLKSKSIDEFEGQVFDYVITLCDKANQECRTYPGAINQMAWDFSDPKVRTGNNPFLDTLYEINNRISMFILVEEKENQKKHKHKSTNVVSTLNPTTFFKGLTDEIRLEALMLTHYHGELCVCELMEALEEPSQPKMSRNLSVLKKAQIITDRKNGKWVFYRINPELPLWAKSVIAQTTENNIPLISAHLQRLAKMENRPDKARFCK